MMGKASPSMVGSRGALITILGCLTLGLLPGNATATSSTTAQLLSNNLFMGTTKVEVGARPNGSFGSDVAAPVGYHPRPDQSLTTGNLGFRGNPTECDWSDPACLQISQGDFFIPGTPYEVWALQIGNAGTSRWNYDAGTGVPGSFTGVDAALPGGTWEATGATDGIQVRFDYSIPSFSWLVNADVTLTNTTGSTINDIYFLRGVDPDNCKADPATGRPPPPLCTTRFGTPTDDTYDTFNTVVSNGSVGGLAQVTATQTDDSYLALQLASPTAVAFRETTGGFAISGNLASYYSGTVPGYVSDPGVTVAGDRAIYVVDRIASLAPGASRTLPVKYVLKEGAPVGPVLNVAREGSGTVTSNPAGINCGSTCQATFGDAEQVTLTATPAPGSVFAGWSGACSGTGSCRVTMDQSRSVTATFVAPRVLAVSKAGNGAGQVNSAPSGINCGETCATTFNRYAPVRLTATPAPGSVFSGWSGPCSNSSGSCDLTLFDNTVVTARFTSTESFRLNVGKEGEGQGTVTSSPSGIDCGNTCGATFAKDEQVTLNASAVEGSTFSGWSGACSGTGPCQVKMDQARQVSASFEVTPVPEAPKVSVTKYRPGPRRLNQSQVIRLAWVECEVGTCQIDRAAVEFEARGESFLGSAIYPRGTFGKGERRLVSTRVPEEVNSLLTDRKSGVAILNIEATARSGDLEEKVNRTIRQGLIRCPDSKCG